MSRSAAMRVWLITVGEPVSLDGSVRLLRTGRLAERLRAAGHDVTFWTGTFDHVARRHRAAGHFGYRTGSGVQVMLIHGPAYRRIVSVQRIRNHRAVAREFRRLASLQPVPDVIVASLPTIELAAAAVEFGRGEGIPVVVDVRDLWPDAVLDVVPTWTRIAVRPLLRHYSRVLRRTLRAATAVVALTDSYLAWGVARRGNGPRGPLDRVLPMSYPSETPRADDIAAAESFWCDCGVIGGRTQFVACFFGNLGKLVDLEPVLAAARALAGRVAPQFRFVLCGDGERLAEYRRLAADFDNVVFPGWIDAARIWTMMRRAAVGLAPYRRTRNYLDNIPNKPVEYLSAGLPVVTSLRGELGELLHRAGCGLTYDGDDGTDLACILETLAQTEHLREQMSRAALTVFRERFSDETVLGAFERYLCDVAVANDSARPRRRIGRRDAPAEARGSPPNDTIVRRSK